MLGAGTKWAAKGAEGVQADTMTGVNEIIPLSKTLTDSQLLRCCCGWQTAEALGRYAPAASL